MSISLSPDQVRQLASYFFDEERSAAADGCATHPAWIGGYRILRVLASGGMGTVYEAEQTSPRRQVALKTIRAGFTSERAVRRFRFEAELLARLRHPGVASIYDSGFHDGRGVTDPYFVMELIPEARSITQYCAERDLTIRECLDLFLAACDAVEHGHRNAILHRDLKPDNILVDASSEDPRIKIIDFGVARATDADNSAMTRTRSGEIVGTLQYMSPEQLVTSSSDLDTRADVYSLGVVLYEILCGDLPYAVSGLSIARAARVIEESTPMPPRARRRAIRKDLERIILKSLEKDREERYESVNALASDIRRFLLGQPVEARPASVATNCARYIVAHPVLTTTLLCAGIVLATLVSLVLTMNWIVLRPAVVEVPKAGDHAYVLSRLGLKLDDLHSGEKRDNLFGKLLDRPEVLGGGRLFVLGLHAKAEHPQAGSLAAYPVHDNRSLLWESRIGESDLPTELVERRYTPRQFSFEWGLAEDFGRGHGMELLSTYVHTESGVCCLRFLDLSGATLRQVWHDGALGGAVWLEKSRQLVVSGWRARHEVHAPEPPFSASRPSSPIVFAMTPVWDTNPHRWVMDADSEDSVPATWYLGVEPWREAANFGGCEVRRPSHDRNDGTRIEVLLVNRADSRAIIAWEVDENGQIAHPEGRPNAQYERLRREQRPEYLVEYRLRPLRR